MSHTKNYIGKKYNRLIVLSKDTSRTYRGRFVYYLMKCECGNIRSYRIYDVVSGRIKSCGCYNSDRSKKNIISFDMESYDYGVMYVNDIKILFDKEDYDSIRTYRWSVNKNRVMSTSRNRILLTHLIMFPPNGMVVDHINGNTLDNRKQNLRICTIAENNKNHKIYNTNTSGTTGVYFDKQNNKWSAQIYINGKVKRLGRFADKEDAINIRKEAEKKYFGEYART